MNAAEAHRLARRARDRVFAQLMRRSFARMGRGCLLAPSTSIRAAQNIALGSGVQLGARCVLSAQNHGEETTAIEVGDNVEIGMASRLIAIGDARIVIGDGAALVGANSVLAGVDIHIGPRVLMGGTAA